MANDRMIVDPGKNSAPMTSTDPTLTLLPRLKAKALTEAQPANVESFYHLRDGIPSGVCCGTACFAARHANPQRWQQALLQADSVHCLGQCYNAPAAVGDAERPRIETHCRQPIVLERIARGSVRTLANYLQTGGYQALASARQNPPEAVMEAVEFSGLRGRGGATFPTGKKWRLAARQPAGEKFIVANADEGDPGAYIDRFLMEDDPHCLLEGMALAAYAVGASQGLIYVRAEYPQAQRILADAVAEARGAGWFGGGGGETFSFDIRIVSGHGSYVCGEETALINSIEGNRPVVMARPPYAVESGLFGKPTVINNVETFANIPWIIRQGGEAYRVLGFSQSRGTKVVSLNSLFRRPGLYEVEFGVPVREIVETVGGGLKEGELLGVIMGGPLAGIIPPHLLDTRFGFEELRAIHASVGHGGVIAFDKRTTIPDLVRYTFGFGADESCGKCVPCRLGSRRIEEIFEGVGQSGFGPVAAKQEWEEISATLHQTSLCGHGVGLGDFAESVRAHYRKEIGLCFE